ncbi:class I SAM-dependent methyltransferase [Aspergillus clavatus NRRL 1]|uniref:Ubiquinone/menaquinone biosynthesis-related protein n=1 Tax=Aspergillus clavatus (strain ATCC 1007 / CBS 513.65 / DSM 816 / NCTC 3887 / NRRL 1 / QM 1276 / 107) TaxID=344612 RepID=A1CKB6_ASPCL|nr:ubiquinone/menaquinone biosynthesis-related protein [Aspergillus clavatus NRRL 1]EAW09590.1 ubiquinone/menaquinone biosynthesis-related protein [Aspergillus clavatus NRRL 1]
MSVSRAGRAALKKARAPVPSPKAPSRVPNVDRSSKSPTAPVLPKRANPHLLNLKPESETPRMSPRAMTFLGVTALTISTYCGYLYASYRREVTQAQSLDVPTDVSDRYNRTAPTFDAEVELSEKTMRMGKKRQELVRRARGDVLEVSCGTGRNLEYYDLGERRGVDANGRAAVQGCRSVTLVDLSPQMVEIARNKFEKLHPGFKNVVFRAEDAKDVQRDAVGGKPAYYDTIIQTMGLCSMPDPVGALRHLGSITEPEKGQILLLEHGRSHYNWLNNILDNLAPAHADRHGCWWNRDIGEIVRQSGLEIVEEKRWHFGTTWKYVLRPARSQSKTES